MKDKNPNQEPWNQTFDDAKDADGNLSRTQLRRQNKNNSLVSLILISIIVLIAAVALIFGVMKSTSGTGNSTASNASTKVQSFSDEKKNDEKKNQAQESDKHASTDAKKASAQKESESTKAADQSKDASGNYVTVKAGQGMYRVATNAGITEQQLMQLNGLTSTSHLHPGQRLRVK